MVIEDEAGIIATAQPAGDRPENVRRVAGLQHIEPAVATSTEHQPGGRQKRVGVLQDKAERSTAGGVGPVLQQPDAVDHVICGVILPLRADDRDVVARCSQSLALQPDATVEGNRQVLDNDERPSSGTHRRRAIHTAHPIPS